MTTPDRTGPVVNGEQFAPGYTPEAAAYEQATRFRSEPITAAQAHAEFHPANIGAWEIAEQLRGYILNGDDVAFGHDSIQDRTAGGSTDGQFSLTIGGRRFSIHVSELEDELSTPKPQEVQP